MTAEQAEKMKLIWNHIYNAYSLLEDMRPAGGFKESAPTPAPRRVSKEEVMDRISRWWLRLNIPRWWCDPNIAELADDFLSLLNDGEKPVEWCCDRGRTALGTTGEVKFMHKNGNGGCFSTNLATIAFCPFCGKPRPGGHTRNEREGGQAQEV